jgi:hypothetical protein
MNPHGEWNDTDRQPSRTGGKIIDCPKGTVQRRAAITLVIFVVLFASRCISS